MMTAVEWLHSEYKRILGSVLVTPQQIIKMSDALENAKEIERGQIIEAHFNGCETGEMFNNENRAFTTDAKQYYEKIKSGENV
jgi:hypothetical protein